MLNQELELSFNMAFAMAHEHIHEFMTVESTCCWHYLATLPRAGSA